MCIRDRHRRACRQRRDAGDDLDWELLDQAGEQIHERAIEERIALANDRDVAPGIEVPGNVRGGGGVNRLGGKPVGNKWHADWDLGLAARQVDGNDATRQAVAVLRSGIREHGCIAQDTERLERNQLGIAGADAEAVEGAGHGLTAAS